MENLAAKQELNRVTEVSTVYPGESVSRSGSPVSDSDSVGVVIDGLNGLADSLLKAYSLMDSNSYRQYAGILSAGVRAIDRSTSLQSGAVRVGGGSQSSARSSSTSGASGACKSSGLVVGRANSIRSMSSWRPSKVPDGLCYSKLLVGNAATSVTARLKEWPALSSLLDLPASSFLPVSELSRFRLQGDSGSVHVKAGGLDGHSFLGSVARVAQGYKSAPGTFGAVLRASAVDVGSALRVNARTVFGGDVAQRAVDRTVSFPGESGRAWLDLRRVFHFPEGVFDQTSGVRVSADEVGFSDFSVRRYVTASHPPLACAVDIGSIRHSLVKDSSEFLVWLSSLCTYWNGTSWVKGDGWALVSSRTKLSVRLDVSVSELVLTFAVGSDFSGLTSSNSQFASVSSAGMPFVPIEGSLVRLAASGGTTPAVFTAVGGRNVLRLVADSELDLAVDHYSEVAHMPGVASRLRSYYDVLCNDSLLLPVLECVASRSVFDAEDVYVVVRCAGAELDKV